MSKVYRKPIRNAPLQTLDQASSARIIDDARRPRHLAGNAPSASNGQDGRRRRLSHVGSLAAPCDGSHELDPEHSEIP